MTQLAASDEICQQKQDLLGSTCSKCWNDDVASSLEGGLDDIDEFELGVFQPAMEAIAVGGLHDQNVCLTNRAGLDHQRLFKATKVTGKDDGLTGHVRVSSNCNRGGTKNVAGVSKNHR